MRLGLRDGESKTEIKVMGKTNAKMINMNGMGKKERRKVKRC